MRNYTTQMEAARKGIITPEMKAVAAKEYRTEEEIRELVNSGKATFYIGFDPTADSLHVGPVSYTHLTLPTNSLV